MRILNIISEGAEAKLRTKHKLTSHKPLPHSWVGYVWQFLQGASNYLNSLLEGKTTLIDNGKGSR